MAKTHCYTDQDVMLLERSVRAMCHDIDQLEHRMPEVRRLVLRKMLPRTMRALDDWAEHSQAIAWQFDHSTSDTDRADERSRTEALGLRELDTSAPDASWQERFNTFIEHISADMVTAASTVKWLHQREFIEDALVIAIHHEYEGDPAGADRAGHLFMHEQNVLMAYGSVVAAIGYALGSREARNTSGDDQ